MPWFLTDEGAEGTGPSGGRWERLKAEHPDDPDAVRAAARSGGDPADATELGRRRGRSHRPHPRGRRDRSRRRRERLRRPPGMPDGLEDVSTYPALFAELAERGYTDEDLAKVAGRNMLRLMREAERVAAG